MLVMMIVVVVRHGHHYKQRSRLYAIIAVMRFAHMTALADRIDRLISGIGRAAAWLILVVVLLQFALVAARYLFGLGSIWLSETVIYAHAAVFMLAAAWTLRAEGHVRVDIFYAEASARTKALIDLVGAVLLLLPFMLVLLWLAVPYAARSWAILERSQEASGLPLVFVLKTLIPVFAVLMALQGLAQAIRAGAVLARTR
jgi:TRAP-type mannitol/chloroaromatic compound transport system permease small subunit